MTLDDVTGSWTIRGRGKHASFSAWTHNGVHGVGWRSAHVLVRRKPGEAVMVMVARGLKVLADRLEHGTQRRPKTPNRRALLRRAFDRLDCGGKVH